MRLRIEQYVSHFMSEERVIISKNDKDLLITRILDEAVGFGPLEPLINDPDITEILINGFDEVYIEKKGRLETVDVSFRDDEHVRHIVDRIVAPLGRRVDESSPMVDARLPDGAVSTRSLRRSVCREHSSPSGNSGKIHSRWKISSNSIRSMNRWPSF